MKAEKIKVAIVGSPNVGKSALFNALSGHYAVVSNYPGTSVEVMRADLNLDGLEAELTDTPGLYSLAPITEEERVTQRILLNEAPAVVVHVLDARNLERMLPLTLQLLEAGLPVVLTLNMMDEAAEAGCQIEIERLAALLGIPVVGATATAGRGIAELRAAIRRTITADRKPLTTELRYPAAIESAVKVLSQKIGDFAGALGLAPRAVALWLLRRDQEVTARLAGHSPGLAREAAAEVESLTKALPQPLDYYIAVAQQQAARELARAVASEEPRPVAFRERLSRWMMQPLTGLPILAAVLYLGLYKFVGGFGAGTVVDILDKKLFDGVINPALTTFFNHALPWDAGRTLFIGEYGVLTMGLRYAIAIILPIVTFFFLVFAVIEDTGYLPRLAMLVDRTFKQIGLSGRAVIPMVLGLGCATMATMVTRTLATRRERLLATLLLALAVPCSAQLGVILALLAGHPKALLIWAGVLVAVFLSVGWIAARLLPGERPSFYMEIPPLRLPKPVNVLTKTYVRVIWYLKEVLPMFLIASLLIWVGQLTGLLERVTRMAATPLHWIGLPAQAAPVFIFGFFRRDYGAAGLYDLHRDGVLDGTQLVVACVALTLFLPCIAQFLVTLKERGWRTGIGISAVVLFISFGTAFLMNVVLRGLGVNP